MIPSPGAQEHDEKQTTMYHLRYSDSSPLPSNAGWRLADAQSKSPPALVRSASMPPLKLKIKMGDVKKKLDFEESK